VAGNRKNKQSGGSSLIAHKSHFERGSDRDKRYSSSSLINKVVNTFKFFIVRQCTRMPCDSADSHTQHVIVYFFKERFVKQVFSGIFNSSKFWEFWGSSSFATEMTSNKGAATITTLRFQIFGQWSCIRFHVIPMGLLSARRVHLRSRT
jgi:hypothetical protein